MADVRNTYLIMVTEDNHNKFYNMFPNGNEFTVKYGRVNSTETTKTYPMYEWSKKYSEKVKKGYKDITNLRVESFVKKDNHKDISNYNIRKIVEKLQEMAKKTINDNYTVSSAGVTQKMVDEAQNIIDSLINETSVISFNASLVRLFTIIPRKMDNVSHYLAQKVEHFSEIISREQNLLDVMQSQISVPNTSDEDESEETILDEVGLVFEEVDDDDVRVIKNLMKESSGKYRNAWKVTNKNTKKKFDDFVNNNHIKDTKLLFHGSRNENFWSILKTGLVLRPTNAVITGKMFGYGIYFAPKCQKSIGYTSLSGSYWAGGSSSIGYLAVFEVAYGDPYNVYSFDNKYYNLNYDNLQKFKRGANCLHAHSGKMLKNDEIVVYKEEQLTIKYLIEIGN